MLTRLLRHAAIATAAAMALVFLAQAPALAGGGPGRRAPPARRRHNRRRCRHG